ncbi:hypothetical protein PTR02_05845 [Serratia nevei]|uniref:hypothetical protein n=1 Tax=Serratia TaxID=613 RepID=UPI001CDC502D|nr:hypothetical protein [Serratia marcescens]MCA4109125.1 hypothetical protein [Serratia marcescens]
MGNKSNHVSELVTSDVSTQWMAVSNIQIRTDAGSSPVQIFGNGLNMIKVYVSFDLLNGNSTSDKNLPAKNTPDVATLKKATTLIVYNDIKHNELKRLTSCPTMDNLSPDGWSDGWAYTDKPNQFLVVSSAANNAVTPTNRAQVIYYVLCKSPKMLSLQIGVKITPTGPGASSYYDAPKGISEAPLTIIANPTVTYYPDNFVCSWQPVSHSGSSDTWDSSIDSISNFWRQYNGVISIDPGVSGAGSKLYYQISFPPQKQSNNLMSPCSTRTINGYRTDAYVWPSTQKNSPPKDRPIVGISPSETDQNDVTLINIGDESDKIRISLIFSVNTDYAEGQRCSANKITVYDENGNSGAFYLSPDLPNYAQLLNDTSWSPCSGNQNNVINTNYPVAIVNNHSGNMFIWNNQEAQTHQDGLSNYYKWTLSPVKSPGRTIFSLYSTNTERYLMRGNKSGKDFKIIPCGNLNDNWTSFSLKPLWSQQLFGIATYAGNIYLRAENETSTHTRGYYHVYGDGYYSPEDIPNLPALQWSFKPIK